jgi:broad specificity phosphatase PhoE
MALTQELLEAGSAPDMHWDGLPSAPVQPLEKAFSGVYLSDQSTDDRSSDAVSFVGEDNAEERSYPQCVLEGQRRVIFVRHGETDFNLAGKIQGTLESQLTEKGHEQARRVGAFLASEYAGSIDRVLCSPKARTMATLDDIEAAFAAAGVALPERLVRRDLREIELTGWEGQCKKDIQREDAAAWKAWKEAPADFVFPSGFAPVPDLWERVSSEWQYLLDSTPPGTTTLVVAHGAFNRTFLALACGLPISEYIDSDDGRFGFSNCGCAEVEWTQATLDAAAEAAAEAEGLRWRRAYPQPGHWSSREEELALAALGPEQASGDGAN